MAPNIIGLKSLKRWLGSQRKSLRRYKGFGQTRAELLNQTEPVSRSFGLDRGQAIDRYYIERFLSRLKSDIRGHVLEIEDDLYASRFGGRQVQRVDILHVQGGNRRATIVADLSSADSIASGTFDCVILTQTLQFIYDLPPAIKHIHRILKSKGVVLVTVPGISQISRYDMDRWGDYWRFTTSSIAKLFESEFPKANLHIEAHGNSLVASAFLHGLAAEELREEELAVQDPDYQVLITARGERE